MLLWTTLPHLPHTRLQTTEIIYNYNTRAFNAHQHPYPTLTRNTTSKLKFKRKGSWMRFWRNWPGFRTFKVGYGHPLIRSQGRIHKLRFKRLLTHHCIITTGCGPTIKTLDQILTHAKKFNYYTLRGIRTGRFWLRKRKGKESKYAHLKSKIF